MYKVEIELNGVYDTYEKLDNALKKRILRGRGIRISSWHYNTRTIWTLYRFMDNIQW